MTNSQYLLLHFKPGSCGCERPKSSCSTRGVPLTPSRTIKSPQVEAQNCACDKSTQVYGLSTPSKPPHSPHSHGSLSGKPPLSSRLSHPNSPRTTRQPVSQEACERHHAPSFSALYVQGRGQGQSQRQGPSSRGAEKATGRTEPRRASQELTLDDMKQISPDSFATKFVWAERCKQFGQGLPWPSEEKKAMKAVRAC
jgi:hypothetical protein